MHTSTLQHSGTSAAAAAFPTPARLRLKTVNPHRSLQSVNCLKCASDQLQQLIQLTPKHLSHVADATCSWDVDSSAPIQHQQQQWTLSQLQLAGVVARQQHCRQLAFAAGPSGLDAQFSQSSYGNCKMQCTTDSHGEGSNSSSRSNSSSSSSSSRSSNSSSSLRGVSTSSGMPPIQVLLATAQPGEPMQQQQQQGGLEFEPKGELLSERPQQQTQQQSDASDEDDSSSSPGVKAALAALRWYKSMLSPMMASTCRFMPTCSQYAMDSYRKFGVAKGTVLTAWRLLRCNPWGESGYDPTNWPPVGLAWFFVLPYSAEVAVLVGAAAVVRLSHALLFE